MSQPGSNQLATAGPHTWLDIVINELQPILDGLRSSYAGPVAPISPLLGQAWLNTATANAVTVSFYDGAQFVTLCTFNTLTHSVSIPASSVSGIGASSIVTALIFG